MVIMRLESACSYDVTFTAEEHTSGKTIGKVVLLDLVSTAHHEYSRAQTVCVCVFMVDPLYSIWRQERFPRSQKLENDRSID